MVTSFSSTPKWRKVARVRKSVSEPNRLIASSIGIAIPKDKNTYGYLSEHHSYGETEERAGEFAEELAAEMLATSLGLDYDQELSWKEKEQVYKLSGKVVRTLNHTQTAVGHKNGLWTTVVAAAVTNLSATLLLVPLLGPLGAPAVLAGLLGLNIGAGLTWTGSLANLLWRRSLLRFDLSVGTREFHRVSLVVTPVSLVAGVLVLAVTT